MKPALWLSAGVILGATLPVLAQNLPPMEGGGCSLTGTWRSNCSEPMFDIDAHHGARGVRDAQYEFAEYQQCLNRSADASAHAAAESIYQAAKQELLLTEREAAIWGFTVR